MNLTKKILLDLIKKIGEDITKLKEDLQNKDYQIEELKLQNQQLKANNLATLDQIQNYIKELEQIKTHYVDNNNNNS